MGKVYVAGGGIKAKKPVTHAIYGAEWDGTSNPLWTRTDAAAGFADPISAVGNGNGSSPFDNLYPWCDVQRVVDPIAGEMVEIPKYWFKWTRDGAAMKLQIASYAADGFHTSPAHADRGDGKGERDYVYVGRYHCSLHNSYYRSISKKQPLTNVSRSFVRGNVHDLGDTYWQYDFAMYWTIMMLYLVEYANWNTQAAIGYGGSYLSLNTGVTDDMIYHTGVSSVTKEGGGSVQYRYVEGMWDAVTDFVDGIYFSGEDIYCIKNPANFNDKTGGTLVGKRSAQGGYITAWTNPTASGFEYALYPAVVGGSATTYVCDQVYSNSTGTSLLVGCSYSKTDVYGGFFMNGNISDTYSGDYSGARLMRLP